MRKISSFLGLLAALLSLEVCAQDPAQQSQSAAFFENEIRPLLIENCIQCHGPKKSESGLRLDRQDHLMRGGDSGPAVSVEHPDQSLILKAIRHEDGLEMPPEKHLNEHQVAVVTKWVEQGAFWPAGMKLGGTGPELRSGPITDEERAFWSFQPITDPAPPVVEGHADLRNPIDAFVLARLGTAGLTMQAAADKRTLLRRATFDLTGLPPTPEEMAAFLADDSPEAFSRVVDRLLASPEYGERWGRHWLDVVRYADTAGETADYPAPLAYKYRNWVVSSINDDLPYDEFLREQVAGDLLGLKMLESSGSVGDPATLARYQQMVTATGFIAISRRFGFDVENYHHLTIQDTIDTLGQAALGLTLGCARCHDHKFDPVTLEDYYSWYGIFDSTRYSFPGSEEKKRPRDMIPALPPALATQAKTEYDQKLASVTQEIQQLTAAIAASADPLSVAGFDGFESQELGKAPGAPYMSLSRAVTDAAAQSPFENVFPVGTRGFRFPSDNENNAFGRTLATTYGAEATPMLYYNVDFRNTHVADGGQGAYRFYVGHGPGTSPALEMGATASTFAIRNGEHYEPVCELRIGEWSNVQVALDLKSRTYSGTITTAQQTFEFSGKGFAPNWDGVIDYTFVDRYGYIPGVTPAHDVDNLALSTESYLPATQTVVAAATEEQQAAAALLAQQRTKLVELQSQKSQLDARGPYEWLYGAVEMESAHDAAIQLRGEPLKKGEVVPRKNLNILGNAPVPADAGSGRLQLAYWLTSSDNPLTARVMANRIWQQHLGRGLVATENDFGIRGDRPSHPELLDWLASRFIESGWSLKAMHRLIMDSETYQQASAENSMAMEKDPDDSLLWRFSPRRLSAEEIRDAMLAVSGTLDPSTGGPHPFPPVESWSFSQHGPYYAVYPTQQRSIYLMQQRLKKHPFLGLFDGADTNASTPHRLLTTVPTQALYLMNNEFVHACGKSLAERVAQTAQSDEDRVQQAYALALNRPAEPDEVDQSLSFLQLYESALATPNSQEKRDAAWSALMRTLLIRNEFLFLN